jgi:hypothetical protein
MEHAFLAPWSLHQLGKYWGDDTHTSFTVLLPQPPLMQLSHHPRIQSMDDCTGDLGVLDDVSA